MHLDGTGAMHTGLSTAAPSGEPGARQNQMSRGGVATQTVLFAFKPGMSLLTREFIEAGPDLLHPEARRCGGQEARLQEAARRHSHRAR
jgi:hypothetical protein